LTISGKTVFMSAGEVSGDHYVARVSRTLREKGFDGRIYGMCGAESRAAGVEAGWGNEALHVMGVSEVFSSLGSILFLMRDIRRDILKASPDAIVVADSPDFHLPLIKSLRRSGYRGKIVYISPPSVWAWRKYRVRALKRNVDLCLPLFDFEHAYLERAGCVSRWVGHPLVEEFAGRSADRQRVLDRVKGVTLKTKDRIAALLPGSRKSEIRPLYPVLSGLYKELEERGCRPVFSVAPGLSGEARNFLMSNLEAAGQCYYEGAGRDIMEVSDVVAGSSGTATAEALLLRRYMVVLYRLRPLSYLIGCMLLRGVKFAVPNILADGYFYPELIQGAATVKNAAAAVCEWLDMDGGRRVEYERRMAELAIRMGRSGVCDFWADEIMEVLR
jgi:lipid-A-disaccharide synthase